MHLALLLIPQRVTCTMLQGFCDVQVKDPRLGRHRELLSLRCSAPAQP